MAQDRDYNKLIHRNRWVKLRRQILTAHPLCSRCEEAGRVTAATEVHHIKPVETALSFADKERLMYNPTNLLPLCHDCHVQVHRALGKCGKAANQQRQADKAQQFIDRYFNDEP